MSKNNDPHFPDLPEGWITREELAAEFQRLAQPATSQNSGNAPPPAGADRSDHHRESKPLPLPPMKVSIAPGTNLNREGPNRSRLDRLMEIVQQLEEAASQEVVALPPIISLNGIHIIKRNSITLIQGRHGSHKSRVAETLAALMLSAPTATTDFLGFARYPEPFSVAYVDTERNHKDELPRAIQTIRRLAGYSPRERLPGLSVCSIKEFERRERQASLKECIQHVRQQTRNHLIVILDVLTDCVSNFNREDEAMALFDFLGNLCEDHDCSIIAVIHENPGSEKARGHIGTEGWNKSATVIQIGFERDNNNRETHLLKLRFLKLRHAQKPLPLYLEFCPKVFNLVQASPEAITATQQSTDGRKLKSQVVCDHLESLLGDGRKLSRHDLLQALVKVLPVEQRTILDHLKEIWENSLELVDSKGRACTLRKLGRRGSTVYYFIRPLDDPEGLSEGPETSQMAAF